MKLDPDRKRAVVQLPIPILQLGLPVEGMGVMRHSFVLAFSSAMEVVLEDLGALEVGVFPDLAL